MNNDTIKKFAPEVKEFLSWCTELVNKLVQSKAPSSTIYHYTDDKGLEGIIKTKTIWLTDIFKLNDPSEIKHGLNHAFDIMTKIQLPVVIKNDFKDVLINDTEKRNKFFVCCFSGDRDDLGQWRAYADDGHGYALGFNCDAIKRHFTDTITMNVTTCIIYDDAKLRNTIEELLNHFSMVVNEMRQQKAYTQDKLIDIFVLTLSYCINVSLCFKHEAYINEQEYRFIQKYGFMQKDEKALGNKIIFRNRPYTLIGYTEFDWKDIKPFPLEEIIIGPSADKRVARRFADDCAPRRRRTESIN
jgi:hypothetical protein